MRRMSGKLAILTCLSRASVATIPPSQHIDRDLPTNRILPWTSSSSRVDIP